MISLAFILLGTILFGATLGTTMICCKSYPVGVYPRKVYFIDEYVTRNRISQDDTIIMSSNTYDNIIGNNKEKEEFNNYQKYENCLADGIENSKNQI